MGWIYPTREAEMQSNSPAHSKRFEPETAHIPAGEFLIGSDPQADPHSRPNEHPQHTLYLPAYSIALTPVTNRQYQAFVEATGYPQPVNWTGGASPVGPDHPVVYVTWHDATMYCRWLSEAMGKPYRLPSEAEWEKAARGTDGRIYPWGNAWEAGRCSSREAGTRTTSPVGSYPRGTSPYGLLDAAGNVWEWTCSHYATYPYDPADGREGAAARPPYVLRGGSYYDDARQVRCAVRLTSVYDDTWGRGFRVGLSTPAA
jgi:formylglycine-generating enzyme required for sulfatase activity